MCGYVSRKYFLNWCLLILRRRILYSRAEGEIRSFAAAPNGPETLPSVSVSALSISSRSCSWILLARDVTGPWDADSPMESQLLSMLSVSVSQRTTERSTTFWSSRMFPGQKYDSKSSSDCLSILRMFFPAFLANRSTKYSTSIGMSSLRSRRGGTCMGKTLSR